MSGAGITTEDKNVILKAYSTQRVGSGSSFESGNQVLRQTVNTNSRGHMIYLIKYQGVQKSDLVIVFFFDGKGDVLIDTVECVMERVNGVSFNDTETIVNISFPYFRWNGSCVDSHLLDCFHT